MNDGHKGAKPYADISKRTSENRPNLGLIIGGATVAVIAVIAAVVFLWPSGDDTKQPVETSTGAAAAANAKQETASVTISGEDLPSLPDTGNLPTADQDSAVGMQIPKLQGESFDGSKVVIDPSDGRPKMIMFVAHWCPHCQAEVPLVQKWIADGKQPKGVDIYVVSTGVSKDKPNYPPSRWLANVGMQPQIMLDDSAGSAFSSYGLTGFPYFVMVDADGNVVQRGSGEVPIEDIDRLVNNLVDGGTTDAATSTTVASG